MKHRPVFFLLAVLCFLFLLLGNSQLAVTDPVESNYALTAKEMVLSGDWISPQIYGTYWFDKPIFIYWMLCISYTLCGFTDFASRLPGALFGTASVVLAAWYMLRRTGRSGATAGGSAASDERRNGPLVLVASKRAVSWRGRPIRLAETEFRLLETLMRRPGAVLTHEELLRVVWGPQAVGELNSLLVAEARLRKKLAEEVVVPSWGSSWSGVGYMLGDLTDFTDFDQA